jgi:hypothetical protein
VPAAPGTVDALPSLRLRKREQHQVLRRVWRSLKIRCSSCGFENAPAIKFCGESGKPLAAPSKPAPTPDPRSYTPKHLAEKILTLRSALEGELVAQVAVGEAMQCMLAAE